LPYQMFIYLASLPQFLLGGVLDENLGPDPLSVRRFHALAWRT
jgi:hypothetical protein